MPRRRRLWGPGDILSVVVRAHEGRPIFATDDDRRFFVARLRRVFVAPDVDLIVWALLINHFHLVIRVRDATPATLFLRLNTVTRTPSAAAAVGTSSAASGPSPSTSPATASG